MSTFTKIDLFGFADFYHRFATTGLTINEMFKNWQKYTDSPRDINDLAKIPKKLKDEIASVKPPALQLMQLLKVACEINGVKKDDVNSRNRKKRPSRPRPKIVHRSRKKNRRRSRSKVNPRSM